ncbi:MAG TPA: lactonase family protein, partial [Polyangiales bacterium]|nr:lactonase family protein [Polyangiales bacterium]
GSGGVAAGAGGSAAGAGAGGAGTAAGSGGAAGSKPAAGSGGTLAAGSGGSAGTPAAGSGGAAPVIPASETVYVSGGGPSIHVFSLATDTGKLTARSTVAAGENPSYLAIAPDKKHLYAVNEADGPSSKILAFSIDPSDGHLTPINSASSGGNGAPHLAVHPSGKWIAVAHYNSGHTTILPVKADGGVGEPIATEQGPMSGCKNAHQAVFDRSGAHLLVPCLGSNYVIQFNFADGKLTYNDPPTVTVPGGPRHLALDPSESNAYLLSELESKLTWFKYDKTTGKLTAPQTQNSFKTTAGSSAHIVVHPAGHWLYLSNRTENSLGLFSIDGSGKPQPVRFETEMIATPRDFSVDPFGKYLLLANQKGSQNVLVYEIAEADGKLTRVQVVPVGDSPTFTTAITLP